LLKKLPNGGNVIEYGIKRDDPSVRSTESGEIMLSEEGLKECAGLDYLFIPEGSCDKDETQCKSDENPSKNIGV
jgi:hypothetical protein